MNRSVMKFQVARDARVQEPRPSVVWIEDTSLVAGQTKWTGAASRYFSETS
jgi:hypothetical protein